MMNPTKTPTPRAKTKKKKRRSAHKRRRSQKPREALEVLVKRARERRVPRSAARQPIATAPSPDSVPAQGLHHGVDNRITLLVISLPRLLVRPTEPMEDLQLHAPVLRELDEYFRNAVDPNKIRIASFFETRKSCRAGPLGWLLRSIVVDKDSADPKMAGVIPIPIDGDHSEICKCKSRSDQAYGRVLAMIQAVTDGKSA